MKLLVGRLILGCILAVLVLADDPVVENAKNATVEVKSKATATTEAPDAVKETKVFGSPEHEIYVIQDQRAHYSHDHDHDHDHHHHHPAPRPPTNYPPHHNHPHQPSPVHHHPHYPTYYPPYYPPSYHYPGPGYAPVSQPYPYYPPMQSFPFPGSMKPITVIETVPSSSGQNNVKPTNLLHQSTGYLWNLFDQRNNDLWNLFGKKGGEEAGGNDDGIHEIVVINKPATSTTGITTTTTSSSNNHGGLIKGKNIDGKDCVNKH